MQDSNLKADDETALVLWYKFIARDNEKTYHVRFAPHDQDKKLAIDLSLGHGLPR